MADGSFQFEDCLLKHYIRREVWLPRCRERQKAVRARGGRSPRRLKYFTFCAVGALDVLLLDRERVVRRSRTDEFDTVFFFDMTQDAVVETRKRIPGANGFPADFVRLLLDTDEGEGLGTFQGAAYTIRVRELQRYQAQRTQFLASFPFDVVNLDVEQYLYRPREQLPGKLTRALRIFFDMQKRSGVDTQGESYRINEFTLMFTTQVGPPNLPKEYLEYLRDTCIEGNLGRYDDLRESFMVKSNGRDVKTFFAEDFDGAFKLAVPKSLSELALEADWFIDGTRGIEIFQFDRDSKDGPYRMLHLAMTVRRQDPPRENRGPGQPTPADAEAEHRRVINRIFTEQVIRIEDVVEGKVKDAVESDLCRLFEHRKKYYTPLDS